MLYSIVKVLTLLNFEIIKLTCTDEEVVLSMDLNDNGECSMKFANIGKGSKENQFFVP